jgi:quinol monooxygenase YgiN
MSVVMTLRFAGDPDKLEQMARENGDMLLAIAERAKEHGVLSHRFYGAEGQVMVLDEWPDAESFQKFFESQRSEIDPMMQQIATSEPEITFWHKLETGDDVG